LYTEIVTAFNANLGILATAVLTVKPNTLNDSTYAVRFSV